MQSTPHVVIAGATGLIGSALVDELLNHGYDVTRLVRSAKTPKDSRVHDSLWDPATGRVDVSVIDGAYGVVNLAGSNISARRWDRIVKKDIRNSRLDATRTLVRAIASASQPPSVFLSGSATGFYGFPSSPVTESSPAGSTFLAGVCVDWERAATNAMAYGTRVALLRTGLVMSPSGGALKKLLLPLRFGLGGPLGSGEQVWSWISLQDHVRAVRFLLENEHGWGPVNLVSPHPSSNNALTHAIANALGKPAKIAVPEFALKAALGQFSSEITQGVHVEPVVLQSLGFTFAHGTVEELAHWVAETN